MSIEIANKCICGANLELFQCNLGPIEHEGKWCIVCSDRFNKTKHVHLESIMWHETKEEIIAELDKKPDDITPEIKNLLAIIHGDGGHYTEKVGLKQSVIDAKEKYYDKPVESSLVDKHLRQVHDILQRKYEAAEKNLKNNPDKCGGKEKIEGYMKGLLDAMAYTSNSKSVVMDEKPASEQGQSEDSYFSIKSRKAFNDRESKLKSNSKWPMTGWYNDKDFCEIYNQSCKEIDRIEEKAQQLESCNHNLQRFVRNKNNEIDQLKARVKKLEKALTLLYDTQCNGYIEVIEQALNKE